MTPFRKIAAGAALMLVLASSQAHAAWNNAFQLCCFGCKQNTHSYYVPPPTVANSAPCGGCCTTSYVQRCYYQPVTTYKTVCSPVTTYRTSYYCEPVCSYRSSCYYDPCTGSSVHVTTPVTTYRMRSKCDAVTSYVQRCVPVTAYRPTYYLEAVQSCAPPPPCDPCGSAAPGVSGNGATPTIPNPNVPGVQENGASFRPPYSTPEPPPAPLQSRPPTSGVKLDHVVSRTLGGSSVNGQVVANNSTFPVGGAKLVFVSKQADGSQQTVTADPSGRFQVTLASGAWGLYMARPDGMVEFHSAIDIRDNESRNVRVVSR